MNQTRTLTQSVVINASMLNSSIFNRNINLNFIPDTMYVRQLVFVPYYDAVTPANSDVGVYAVTSSLVPQNTLGLVTAQVVGADLPYSIVRPDTMFNLLSFNNNVQYNFQLLDPLGIATRPRGYIYALLEFTRTERIPN